MKQETRQWLAALTAYGSWTLAVILTWLRLTEVLDQRFGVLVILLIGVAMAGGIKLSRMRLAATMTAVFQAGILAAEQRQRERDERNA